MSRSRRWDKAILSLAVARQSEMVEGDIVRSYDFPGLRDDCYVEGVVMEREEDRVRIHITDEVLKSEAVQVNLNRLVVNSPLGVSMFSGAPVVFLVAKRKERS